MNKKIIIPVFAIILFCLLYLSATIAINRIILPERIKPSVIETAQKLTGRKVDMGLMRMSFLKGVNIYDFIIHDVIDSQDLEFKNINLRFRYIPLIFRRKLVYSVSTSPAKQFMCRISAKGVFDTADKALTTRLYIYKLPLAIINEYIKEKPVEIGKGYADIAADVEFDVSKTTNISARISLEELRLRAQRVAISGNSLLEVIFTRDNKTEYINYSGSLTPRELKITPPLERGEITVSGGKISFDRRKIELTQLGISNLGQNYVLSGTINNLHQPKAILSIQGSNLDVNADVSYSQDELNIKKVELKTASSNIELQGNVARLAEPFLNIYLSGHLNIRDLKYLPFKFVSKINESGVDCLLNTELHLSGKMRYWQDMNCTLKVKSGRIGFRDYYITDVDVIARTAEKKLKLSAGADAYNGRLEINLERLVLAKPFSFVSRLTLEEINLKKMNESSLKSPHDIAGYLAGDVGLSGNLRTIKDVKGEGWIEVTQGRLWELPLFKGLLGMIEIAGAEKNVFREAHCTFTVKDGAVNTSDLELISQRLTILAKGNIFFDGRLDMRLKMQFPEVQEEAKGLDKLQDILLKGTGSLVKEVRVTGSLKKPEYKAIPASIESIFENILR